MKYKSINFLPLFMVFLPSVVFGEFVCESDISYKWKKAKDEEISNEVYFSSVRQAGQDEASAKQSLTTISSKEKARAVEACRKERENLSGCIANKYSTLGAVLQTLNFQARKAVQDAVSDDCKSSQGICVSASSTEPVCKEEKKAEEGAESGDAGKDAGKGDAKKDKGKK